VSDGSGKREIIVSLLLGGVAPYVLYEGLVPPLSEAAGLVVGAIPPAAWQVYSLARTRRIDVVSAFSLTATAIGLVLAWTSGDERSLLVRDAWMTGFIGVICLMSAWTPWPVLYFVLRAAARAEEGSDFEETWRESRVLRQGARRLTALWGVAGLFDMAIRQILVDRVSTSTYLAVSPVMFWGSMGLVGGATYFYGNRIRDAMDAELDAQEEVQPPVF